MEIMIQKCYQIIRKRLLINRIYSCLSLKYIFVLSLFVLASSSAMANNISVTGISLTGQNTSSDFTLVQFTVSWENSFRVSVGPGNWDAAWVFVKYRAAVGSGGDGLWRHATLLTTGHTATNGSTITVPSDGKGALLYKSENGVGNNNFANTQLRWNYGADYKNATTLIGDNDNVDVQVFAIEMIYVPQGSFYVGSGGGEYGAFFKYPSGSNPYQITSENAVNVGTTTDYLYYTFPAPYPELSGDGLGPVPNAFPKGFNAFYCMKYEMSQQQYVDFLNCLTRTQQDTRTTTSLPVGTTSVTNRYVMSNSSSVQFRNGIRCDATVPANDPITFYCDYNGNGTGNESGDGQTIASNWITQSDLLAYLDWSGLRPMTELEYEKACRGTLPPIANEYVWGTTNGLITTSGITNPGTANEISSNGGNCLWNDTPAGPIRVGCFATSSTTRITSGATYYGIMNMSDNLMERAVSVGNPQGRLFNGIHGNGLINSTGNADENTWNPENMGFRGGSFIPNSFVGGMSIIMCYRQFGCNADPGSHPHSGGRGVRTSP
jgi:formylglycine-generating enzyme required for sulfatase activity